MFISVQTMHSEILPCFVGFVCLSKQVVFKGKDLFYCHMKMIDMIMYVQEGYLLTQYSDIQFII